MTADRDAISLALKLVKALEKWLKATVDERKEIEKQKKEVMMKDWLVFVFNTSC